MIKINLLVFVAVVSPLMVLHGEEKAPVGDHLPASGYEIITLKTSSGSEGLAAFFGGNDDQAVVFVPGAVFGKESWFDLAMRLQRVKIASLSLDGKAPHDVVSAIAFLKEKGFGRIVLVGGSMGGAAILGALEEGGDQSVCKVVLLAPADGSPIKNARINKLFIVSKADALGIYPAVRRLYESSAEPKQIVEFEGTAHAQHLFNTGQRDDLVELIIEFILADE